MRLSDLKTGEAGIITKVRGRGAFRRRINELGFVKGKKILVIKNAPLRDPIEYKLLDYNISLRRSEAEHIDITTISEARADLSNYKGVIGEEKLKTTAVEKSKTINVAFVGNPNSGKTTIFNYASKSSERVGNYGGVTIEAKTARYKYQGYTFNITDLPGTYSLSAYSPEEIFVRNHIIKNTPDVVINIIDASNLERNLYLTTQLIDMDIKVIVALNMFDSMVKRGDKFDYHSLGNMLGIPFIPTVGSKGRGITDLFQKVIDVYNDEDPSVRHIHINYGTEIEESINKIQNEIKSEQNYPITDIISSRYAAIKLLVKDKHIESHLKTANNFANIKSRSQKEITRLENEYHEESDTIIADAKYGFIHGALKETYKSSSSKKHEPTEIIDSFLTNKLFGFPIFIFFIWFMFWVTFNVGQYPMNWIDNGIIYLGKAIHSILPNGIIKDLLIDGVIGGVGGVIVFLPNILILFFFISLMEDTGYMARTAFIMDKLMHKIGLHGKSFIPLIMGFGCNVPAIMATRTIENKNNRLLTILINPFMSCSARLPVYILLIGTFFPKNKGTVLFLIYMIGISLAIMVSMIFKKIFFTKDEVPFVMELPPYRLPTLRSTLKHMWYKASQYLKKMGGVILIASILIWGLEYFPRNVDFSIDYNKEIEKIENLPIISKNSNSSKTDKAITQTEKAEKINSLLQKKEAEHQEKSYLGQIGKFIEPAIKPLGFDWKIGISLLSGIAAKEVVVSTMGVMYMADNEQNIDQNESLSIKLRNAKYNSGKNQGEKVFSNVIAFSLIIFILIYFPCVAVIAAIRREAGSWVWALFTVFYTTSLAWLLSFIIYKVGNLVF